MSVSDTNKVEEWSLFNELFPESSNSNNSDSDASTSLSAHYNRIHSSATQALFGYLDESHRCSKGTTGAFSVKDETFKYSASSVEVQVSASMNTC